VPDQGNDTAPLHLQLQARPEYAHLLRERIRMWLEEAGANKREIFEVLLATSEAYTNAVKHPQKRTSRLVDIDGSITDHAVSISIRDYGTWANGQTRKNGGGMGLPIIERLMDAVHVERLLDGTTVTMRRRLGMH
jgi:anti-sigma regulatory factor (Ser/Thr protein kinase)